MPIVAANPKTATSSSAGFAVASVFSKVVFVYQNKYSVNASVRRDGSSRFGKNTTWGLFPAVSAAWVMSDEALLKKVKFLDELKLRASYGETGNDQFANGNNFPSLGTFGGGVAYNGISGITANTLANADLQWERNVET